MAAHGHPASPLAQGRGLKLSKEQIDLEIKTSPLAQGRGLKQQVVYFLLNL